MAILKFVYGAMNSGKSASLLQMVHNYEEQGLKALVLKPSIDTKGGKKVVSRTGLERKVDISIYKDVSISKLITLQQQIAVNIIVVDEAQFLTREQIDELYFITKNMDLFVVCYGLRSDFQTNGFEGSVRLLEIADELEELHTVCTCGVKATHNLRMIDGSPIFDGNQVCIDNQDKISYTSVCGKCYLKFRKGLYE